MKEQEIQEMAATMRRKILDVSHACGMSAHLGGGLSMVELTASLYGSVMNYDPKNPEWPDRDRFILSKGHGVLGYFSALCAAGIISDEVFATFQSNESELIAHPVMNLTLGIESSNGSLGQGLSMAVGISVAAKKQRKYHKVYVLLGDGECNEGSVWEAVMSGAHYRLDNLTAIVDYNKLQSDGDGKTIMSLGDLAGKWEAFGWNVCRVDGHNIPEILDALNNKTREGMPKVLLANTVKGKGVPFMENNNEWHHNRLTKVHYERALREIGAVGND